MKKGRTMRWLLAAATAIALAGCAHQRKVESVRLGTLSFERGMRSADVEDILGSPDATSPTACGATRCVSWTYATNTKESLRVLFQSVDGKLLVDSWEWN